MAAGRRKFNEKANEGIAYLRANSIFPDGGTEAEIAGFLFESVGQSFVVRRPLFHSHTPVHTR